MSVGKVFLWQEPPVLLKEDNHSGARDPKAGRQVPIQTPHTGDVCWGGGGGVLMHSVFSDLGLAGAQEGLYS